MQLIPMRATFAVAALFAIGGCSGAGSSGPPPAVANGASGSSASRSMQGAAEVRPGMATFVHAGVPFASSVIRSNVLTGWAQPSYPTNKPLVFEADQNENAVNVYAAAALGTNPAPLVSIPVPVGCPYGMALDKTGALYVASNCGGNTIERYPKGGTTPSSQITTGISNPLGLAINARGTLYVSNYPASITEYPFGKKSPSVTVTGQGLSNPFGLALDNAGNLYVADFGASQVFEIAAGTTTVTPLNLQDLTEPIGVAIDETNGDLWVTDLSGKRINVYPHGSTTPSHSLTGYSQPYAISIYETGSVAVSDLGPPVAVFAFKANHYTPYATLTTGMQLPTGVLWAKP